jgi:hypothetical protein
MAFLSRSLVVCSGVILVLALHPGRSIAGRLQAEVFDGDKACLVGDKACPATEYRTFIDDFTSVEIDQQPGRRVSLRSSFDHEGGRTILQLEIDELAQRYDALLIEQDREGNETFPIDTSLRLRRTFAGWLLLRGGTSRSDLRRRLG